MTQTPTPETPSEADAQPSELAADAVTNASETEAPQPTKSPKLGLHPLECAFAWLVPGLGHFMLGLRKRGIILFLTISLLWTAGLLIGGLGVIDRQSPTAPFVRIGQYFLAPSLAVEYAHRQRYIVPEDIYYHPDMPGLSYRPSFGSAEELGVLYTAIAGMLNLMAMIDVLYRDNRSQRRTANDSG